MNNFDSLAITLTGRNLIEASAGTGKTYAIASLFLRLVVEEGLLPEQILVVTFTEAATSELRDRIRLRLREARDAVDAGSSSDPFLYGLMAVDRCRNWPGSRVALERLDLALQSFDCAAISTIHGFCSRALQENAFASGSLYDTELLADQKGMIQEVVDDFWRKSFFGTDAQLLPLVVRKGWSPELLAGFLRGKLGNPSLQIVPAFTLEEITALEQRINAVFLELQQLWERHASELEEIVTEHKGLSRNDKTYRPDLLPELLQGISSYLAGGNPFDLCDDFRKFTTPFIEKQRLKKHDPPQHPFFDRCGQLLEQIETRLLALKWSALEYARDGMAQAKQRHNLRCYDDLLSDLCNALHGDNGDRLAAEIRGRFSAALIDEFQDTDQTQYRIFRRIFPDDSRPLFLIGDPKQAIYSFRGADIFAYLQAREDIPVERHFTMTQNWRSTPALVGGVNHLFQQQERPFVIDDFCYPTVTAAKPGDDVVLAGRDPAPLQLWFMGRSAEDGKVINVGSGGERIVAAVADEIVGLLADGRAGRATIGDKAVAPHDIAVIVRSHKQAALVHEELSARGVPAVVRSSASIFASSEARDLALVLAALVEPASEARLRAALTTCLFGVSGNELASMLDDERSWESHQRK